MPNFFTTPTGAGAGTGVDFANAFNWTQLDDWITNTANAGDILYALAGTYNASAQVTTSRNGLVTNPIKIIGVADQALTPAVHGALPFFDFGANNRSMVLNNYWQVHNIRFDSAENSYSLRLDIGGLISNCEALNTGTGSAFSLTATNGRIVNSIAESTLAAAIDIGGIGCAAYGNQVNGGLVGIDFALGGNVAVANLIRDCTIGIQGQTGNDIHLFLNTIYNCVTGILSTDGQRWSIIDNILAGCTNPAVWIGIEQKSNYWNRNVWFNSATPLRVTKGPDAINADPQFVDASLGTAAGFTVRAEVARNLGLNLTTIGSVPPSIFEGGENGVGGFTGVGMDFSDDLALLGDLETLVVDDKEVQGCHRNDPDIEQEEVATEGVYLRRDVTFLLPVGEAIYTVGKEPTPGTTIIDGDETEYTIMTVRRPKLGTPGEPFTGDFYRVECVSLRISDRFGLDNTVTHFPRVEETTAWTSRVVTHPNANTAFSGVPAKIMLRPSPTEDEAGQREFTRHFDVYVDGEVGDIKSGDLLKDEDGEQYEITGYRLRKRIGELPVIECEIRPH